MQIRDQVNDAFFKEEGETQPTIIIITKIAIQLVYSNHYYAKLLSKIPGRKEGGLEKHHFTPEGIY